MTIDVLGLGESLSEYDYADNIRFGVNDIASKVVVDYLVCVDLKTAFTQERLKVIEETRCFGFYSQLTEWATHPNFKKITLCSQYPETAGIQFENCYPKSVFSPYVAVGLAFHLFQPKEIRLFGVDMVNHKLNDRKERIQRHWQILKNYIEQRDCAVKVYGAGILAQL